MTFEGHGGKQVAFDVTDSTFEGQGVTLRGRLLLPKGAGSVPIAVEVHGSERDSENDYNYMQYLLPEQGVGVLVYDRRGPGRSAGPPTNDFHLVGGHVRPAAVSPRTRRWSARACERSTV